MSPWRELLDNPFWLFLLDGLLMLLFVVFSYRTQIRLILKSLARNPVRTLLTSVATIILVVLVTGVWTILWFLDLVTEEKTKDLKAIVTERWQIPSQMPFAYAASLSDGAAARPSDVHPQDSMTWQFVAASLEPDNRTRENLVFFLCMEPAKVLTMLDGLDEASPKEMQALTQAIRLVEADKRRIIVGKDRLQAMNKKIGERIALYPINYKDLQLDECEIVGTFPDGRYNQTALMSRERLNDALDLYKRKTGKPHFMANKTLNVVWLRVPDTETFSRMADQIMTSSLYTNPPVKCETASSGVASFLDGYRTLIWGMRWVLAPALLASMALVIAVAISISVRERRTEMAVLKVLGFGPNQIMLLVLGEAVLVGGGSGLLSSVGAYLVVNHGFDGVKFPIAFFPVFLVPVNALWWGPVIGSLTALAGSFFPAWSARSVKVAEVFAKTT